MCIIFEIYLFLNFFDYATFAFTRFWIVGLFREQAQGWFVRRWVWERNRSKNVHKVFGLGNKHLNNLWGRTSTYISLSNPFSFAIFFSYLLSFACFWTKNMYMCYPNLFHSLFCFIGFFFPYICFVFRFGGRSTTSHVWGLLAWVASIFTKPSWDI
jgi:hypothetical protein